MATHRAPLGYRPPLPLAILAVVLGLSFGCSKHEVPPTKPLPPPVLTSPRIAYVDFVDGVGNLIHLLDPATGQVTDLPQAGRALDPAISPDGTRIAFARVQPPLGTDIFTVAADGTDPRRCTTTDTTWSNRSPRWSPDGQRIAFSRQLPNFTQPDIYTVRVDGTDLHRVTTGGNSYLRDWSPDGTRLLFVRQDTLGSYMFPTATLATIAPDGTDTRILYQAPLDLLPGADYSPDGSRILISEIYVPTTLLVMNADGSDVHPLPDSTAFGYIGSCSWSPSGSAVVFEARQNPAIPGPWLWTLRFGDTHSAPLIDDSQEFDYPDWGPKP